MWKVIRVIVVDQMKKMDHEKKEKMYYIGFRCWR